MHTLAGRVESWKRAYIPLNLLARDNARAHARAGHAGAHAGYARERFERVARAGRAAPQ